MGSPHGPLARYAKLRIAHAPGTFSPRPTQRKPLFGDLGTHHGTCVRCMPWCMSGSPTFGAFPAHSQLIIFRIWQEAHVMDRWALGWSHGPMQFNWRNWICFQINYTCSNSSVALRVIMEVKPVLYIQNGIWILRCISDFNAQYLGHKLSWTLSIAIYRLYGHHVWTNVGTEACWYSFFYKVIDAHVWVLRRTVRYFFH